MPENERLCSFSGWCWKEECPTLKNKQLCSFSRGVRGGVGQRKVHPAKTSRSARFRGGRVLVLVVVVVVVVREGGGGGQRKVQTPKTSAMARFRGVARK